MNSFTEKARRARLTALACYLALHVVFFLKTVAIPVGDKAPSIIGWAVYSLPLLLFLPGMLRSSYRSYVWLCFVLLIYFIEPVIYLVAVAIDQINPDVNQANASAYAWLMLVLIVVLYLASVFFVRWQAKARHEEAVQES